MYDFSELHPYIKVLFLLASTYFNCDYFIESSQLINVFAPLSAL